MNQIAPRRLSKFLVVVCWAACIVRVFVPACSVVKDHVQSLRVPDVEFVYFYSMGRMFNQYPAARLYDYELQKKVCMEIRTAKGGQYGPNPFPPFVGVLFRPFARLSFSAAYLLWVSISLCAYLAGLLLFMPCFFPDTTPLRSMIFCAALCSMPFIWTLLGGQISMIGFFALALALREEHQDRPILSGLALSLCLYKPTLLILLLPMLVVTRRYKTLLGVAGGGIILGLFATAVEGIHVWPGYARLLLSFASGVVGNHTTSSVASIWYYADLVSFFSLIPGGRSWVGCAILFPCAAYAGWTLLQAWRRSIGAAREMHILVWGATLTWTLVLNVYVPIYDSVLLVLGVIATAGVLRHFPEKRFYHWVMLLWILILACSWITVPVAQAARIQIVTLLFAALGVLQLAALRRVPASDSNAQRPIEPDQQFVAMSC